MMDLSECGFSDETHKNKFTKMKNKNIIRTLNSKTIYHLSTAWDSQYPAMKGYVSAMIRHGFYDVADPKGNILPMDEALRLVKTPPTQKKATKSIRNRQNQINEF